jgi:hypothetical protein
MKFDLALNFLLNIQTLVMALYFIIQCYAMTHFAELLHMLS